MTDNPTPDDFFKTSEQPDDDSLPPEFVEFAQSMGITQEQIDAVQTTVKATKGTPAYNISINALEAGTGLVRVAREYDVQIAQDPEGEGKSLITVDVPEHGMQIGFIADRAELVRMLTVDVPRVTPPPSQN